MRPREYEPWSEDVSLPDLELEFTLSSGGREVPSGDVTVESATMVVCEACVIDRVGLAIEEMARDLVFAVLDFFGVAVDEGGIGVPVLVSVCGMAGVSSAADVGVIVDFSVVKIGEVIAGWYGFVGHDCCPWALNIKQAW